MRSRPIRPSPGRWCAGCRSRWAGCAARATSTRWRARCPTRLACCLCRPSLAWACPTRIVARAGTLLGMTLDTTPAHIARAFLEALGCLVYEMLEVIRREAGVTVERLHVGGGLSSSDAACQTQADVLGMPVVRVQDAETTVRAAALLAGLGPRSGRTPPRCRRCPAPRQPSSRSATRRRATLAWCRGRGRSSGRAAGLRAKPSSSNTAQIYLF